MFRNMFTASALFLLAVLLTGCMSRTLHVSDIDKVPESKDMYGGSFIIWPWIYKGSDEQHHYFRYTYTRGNFPKQVDYRIPVKELKVSFQMEYTSDAREWIHVTLHNGPTGVVVRRRGSTSKRAPEIEWKWIKGVPAEKVEGE